MKEVEKFIAEIETKNKNEPFDGEVIEKIKQIENSLPEYIEFKVGEIVHIYSSIGAQVVSEHSYIQKFNFRKMKMWKWKIEALRVAGIPDQKEIRLEDISRDTIISCNDIVVVANSIYLDKVSNELKNITNTETSDENIDE